MNPFPISLKFALSGPLEAQKRFFDATHVYRGPWPMDTLVNSSWPIKGSMLNQDERIYGLSANTKIPYIAQVLPLMAAAAGAKLELLICVPEYDDDAYLQCWIRDRFAYIFKPPF